MAPETPLEMQTTTFYLKNPQVVTGVVVWVVLAVMLLLLAPTWVLSPQDLDGLVVWRYDWRMVVILASVGTAVWHYMPKFMPAVLQALQ